ncbi:membrane transporter, partial [Metarhizium majus ARSEF 297]
MQQVPSSPELDECAQLSVPVAGLEGLTLYEKKCRLVNREIDRQGMGRYQWYIWILCGLGYFLDLLWAQAFGLVLSPVQQEMGFRDSQSGNISTSFNAGLTAGAIFWGLISDIVGRRWAFNLTCLLSCTFGLCLGFSNDYKTLLVITAFVGFGVGGNIPVDSAIFLEFVPQPLGVVVCSAIAFGFIPVYACSPNFSEKNPLRSCRTAAPGAACCSRSDNMGWRYFLYTLGAMSFVVFFLRFAVFRFRETPKYLLYKREDAKAIATMQHIAKVNRRQCRLTIEAFQTLEPNGCSEEVTSSDLLIPGQKGVSLLRESSIKFRRWLERYKMLFDGFQMTRLTILVWLTYIMDFWGFTVAGFYLPRILALKNGAASASLSFTYAAYIYTYAPGIVGVLLGAFVCRVPAIGRKWTMVVSSGLMGASILLLSKADTIAKNEGLFALQYFFQSMFNAVLYGWTPEAFPAPVRGTACGVASFWGRLFGIISPLIAQHLYGRTMGHDGNGDINSVLYLAGAVSLGCVLTTALLPSKLMEAQDERS